MLVEETKLKGCFILKPKIFSDDRGWFTEIFNEKTFSTFIGRKISFVQDNESKSVKGVLRGLHYQKGKYAQAKLVRVTQGEVLDIAVDLREDSETYGKHTKVILNSKNNIQLFIPRGFAHGFLVLSETAVFSYKCDNFYNKASETGIIYNDPTLNIDWEISEKDIIISEKDLVLPKLIQTLND